MIHGFWKYMDILVCDKYQTSDSSVQSEVVS